MTLYFADDIRLNYQKHWFSDVSLIPPTHNCVNTAHSETQRFLQQIKPTFFFNFQS